LVPSFMMSLAARIPPATASNGDLSHKFGSTPPAIFSS
jgi:hypothetical protein